MSEEHLPIDAKPPVSVAILFGQVGLPNPAALPIDQILSFKAFKLRHAQLL
jgi:hypothetical protein